MTESTSLRERLQTLEQTWRDQRRWKYEVDERVIFEQCADELAAVLAALPDLPQRFDLIEDPERGLHAVLTRHGIASRSDYLNLIGDLVHWAADALRSSQPLAALPEAPAAAWLDTREFYDVMQTYRCALREKPADVVEAFEAVKAFIRTALDPPPAPPAAETANLDGWGEQGGPGWGCGGGGS